jgi:hypothetical protein
MRAADIGNRVLYCPIRGCEIRRSSEITLAAHLIDEHALRPDQAAVRAQVVSQVTRSTPPVGHE